MFIVDRESNATPVHPITSGKEAEETRKAIGNGDLMQKVNYQISLYLLHENRKIERKLRKTSGDQWRSKKSGKNEGWHE